MTARGSGSAAARTAGRRGVAEGPRSRLAPLVVGLVIAALALLSVVAADAASGPAQLILANAGAVARYGAPVAKLLADLGGAVVLGGALVAGWGIRDDADRARAMRLITLVAGAWTLAQLASLLTSYAVATGQPIGDPRFGSDLGIYVSTDLGAWLLTALAAAAVTTSVAAGTSGRMGARIVAAAAALALIAKAMTGHASGTANHDTATSTMMIHLLAVGVWVGGLAILQVLPDRLRDDAALIRAFSRLALWCWIAIAISGVWALATRMNGLGDVLTSAYVQIGLLKALILVLLGLAGAYQRRLLAERATGATRPVALYRRLAVLELALMGIAIALAAAMSASPPPAAEDAAPTTPAETLTGSPLPPAPSLGAVLARWEADAGALALLTLVVLVWTWRSADERGRRALRALIGSGAAAAIATCGAPAIYGRVLMSAHLIEDALLLLVAGPLLAAAFGARLSALRLGRWRLGDALLPAGASRRRRLLVLAGTTLLATLLPAVVYATDLIRAALASNPGHLLLIALSTAAGALLGSALLEALDAARAGERTAEAAAVLAGSVAGLAASAIALIVTDRLIAAERFGSTGRPWLRDALADQHRAGWILLVAAGVWGAAVLGLALSARRASGAPSAGAPADPTGP